MYLPNHAFYSRNRPVVPLPNPGEGGPVYPLSLIHIYPWIYPIQNL